MSLIERNTSVPFFELFGLQHKGQALNFVWTWPSQVIKAGFDDILRALDHLHVEAAWLVHARYCTVERAGSSVHPIWILSNSSHEMVCSVNQSILLAGSQVRLDHGDEIELGLTRFMVSMDATQKHPFAESASELQSQTQTDTQFQLTELDVLIDNNGQPKKERYGDDRADFSDLISFAPEEAVAQAAPPVVEHGEKPENARPSLGQALAAGAQMGDQENVSDLLKSFTTDEPHLHQKGAIPEGDPFEALHAQYLYKLRNPTHTEEVVAWQDKVQDEHTKQTDPMQYWSRLAGHGSELNDLLGQSQSITTVIHGLDPLGHSKVLEPEPFDSVMHLFAPQNLRTDATGSLDALVQRSLPGLTRHEHHSLSLDSAMPIPGGEHTLSKSNPK